METDATVNQKESGVKMRKCSHLGKDGLGSGFWGNHTKALEAASFEQDN
jgi:hypothetical protein